MAGNKNSGKPKSATKSMIYQRMAETTKQPRKQVAAYFDALTALIKQEIGKKGPGIFTLPGLLKIKRVEKKATQDRMGINPQTREPMMIKGKPKRIVVRALPLKALKEMVK
jgi:nucleoid DNA-binding protein